jgi:hypothetical protein
MVRSLNELEKKKKDLELLITGRGGYAVNVVQDAIRTIDEVKSLVLSGRFSKGVGATQEQLRLAIYSELEKVKKFKRGEYFHLKHFVDLKCAQAKYWAFKYCIGDISNDELVKKLKMFMEDLDSYRLK